ncbi:MAG: peptide chain release factor N(5)-glutamine methyltransferase [Xanthomonadales bacterium]
MNVRQLLAEGRQALADTDLPALEATILLGHVLGHDRAWFYANPEAVVTGADTARYRALLQRRAEGAPIAYLTGVREFWSMELTVTPDVLIPRPETELLVETVLERIPADATCRIADLGTGSGAVALAIAAERPACEVHATELSAAALAVARTNAERLLPGRVHFHHGSWCAPLAGAFRLIASNPPYVERGDPHLDQGDCRFEPRAALTPGADGLAAIRAIARQAMTLLEAGGWLVFEHGFEQGPAARAVLEKLGYEEVATRTDLEGRERVTSGRRPAV